MEIFIIYIIGLILTMILAYCFKCWEYKRSGTTLSWEDWTRFDVPNYIFIGIFWPFVPFGLIAQGFLWVIQKTAKFVAKQIRKLFKIDS